MTCTEARTRSSGAIAPQKVRDVDVVVSFVLYRTPPAEVDHAIACALASACSVHVIVVDNGGSAWRPPADDRISVVLAPSNLGYGRGHNAAFALRAGHARFHVIANTDVSFAPHVLPELIDYLQRAPAVAAVAPRVRYPDGRLQPTARLLPAPLDLLRRRLGQRQRPRDAFVRVGIDARKAMSLPFLSGCFLVVRADVLDRIGGFDPRFFVYGEDVDLSRRLHREGPTVLLPEVEIGHLFRSERAPSARRFALLVQGYARYFAKWGWVRDADRDEINRRAMAQA